MWERNKNVLAERFPEVLAALEAAPRLDGVREVDDTPVPTLSIAGIQLTSAYDRAGEAREQAGLVPEEAREIRVYGLGLGDLQRRLLTRPALEELTVVTLSRSLAREVLERFDNADWMRDPRVRLVLGEDEGDVVRAPFAALPGELSLASAECARLRDLVAMELAAPHTEERLTAQEEQFRLAIQRNLQHVVSDGDVAELFGTRPGGRVFVAGAGASLEGSYDELRSRSDLLICVDGALRALLEAGIRPDVVVSIDAHEVGVSRMFDADLSGLESSTLVYFPVVPEPVVAGWPGRRLVAYGHHARWSDLAVVNPRGRLWVSGSVTHAAVDLAVHTGAKRVVLAGCDFGFSRGRTHVAGNPYSAPAEEVAVPGVWVESVRGERLQTLPNLCAYLRDLERYVAAHPEVDFYNASREGALIAGTRPADEVALGQ
jgi:hypothetical protein